VKVYLQAFSKIPERGLNLPGDKTVNVRKCFYLGFRFYFQEAKLRYLFSGVTYFGLLKTAVGMFLNDFRTYPKATLFFLCQAYILEIPDEDNALGEIALAEIEKKIFWVSRQAVLGGVIPNFLDESIDYDFYRQSKFTFLRIWATSLTPRINLGRIPNASKISASKVRISDIPDYGTPQVVKLFNAKVLHGSVVTVQSDFYPLDNSQFGSLHWPHHSPVKTQDGHFLLDATKSVDISVGIFVGHSQSWYHFLIEILPRYLAIPDNERQAPVVLPRGANERIIEILRLFGFSNFLQVGPLECARASTLTTVQTPSRQTSSFSHGFNKTLIELQSSFEKIFSEANSGEFTKCEKIYVQRPLNVFRQISNRDELSKCLEERGFQVVHPENMYALDQIRLFRNAKLIIAESGASLTSLLFSQRGTKVLEIQQIEDRSITFWHDFCTKLGMDHHKFYSEPSLKLMSNRGLRVNIESFTRTVESLLVEQT
jgi:hypothetical protein